MEPFTTYRLDYEDDSFLKNTFDIRIGKVFEYPKLELGFHHWIHAIKNNTKEMFQKFPPQNKVYLVMNPYETQIEDSNEDIHHYVQKKFSSYYPKIISRGFYKMWELIHEFDLVPKDSKEFSSVHLAEAPGSFLQAVLYARKMNTKNTDKDQHMIISIHPTGDNIPAIDTAMIQKLQPNTYIHKTTEKENENGDLLNPKVIESFVKQSKGKSHLITADGGFIWKNENLQEQEVLRLLLAEIYTTLLLQKQGGHFVLKIFETYTFTSLKILLFLKQLYKEVYVTKPYTSRMSNSEKYVVCKNFLPTEKQLKPILDTFHGHIETLYKNPDLYIYDMFSDYILNETYKNFIKNMNIKMSNLQMKSINVMIDFIKQEDYHGEIFQTNKQIQLDTHKKWIQKYLS